MARIAQCIGRGQHGDITGSVWRWGAATSSSNAFPASASLANQCTPSIEKAYLRSFVDETYLWYNEVPTNLVASSYATPQAYFDVLKTTRKTASGKPVDQFHWSQTTASWNAAQSGISEDYGIEWAALSSYPPRVWYVAEVAPNSPAGLKGVKRGDRLTSVNNVDFVINATQSGVNAINAGLFPSNVTAHTFGFNYQTPVSLTPATYTVNTVQKVKTFTSTGGGIVGYLVFDSHLEKSQDELIAAINQLKAAKVTDLVIDMRYNGGGLLYVASQLAYMIAGPSNTNGKVFEQLIYNDKLTNSNRSYPFLSTTINGNVQLPYLGLKRVTLLVGGSTASASESLINGLRGVDVTVNLIGSTTRGKPYGFVPQDNCGYTYFAIQFKGANHKGFGDYADGFSPNSTCTVGDDYFNARGDAAEGMLKAALSYQVSGSCPASASANMALAEPAQAMDGAQGLEVHRPAFKDSRILTGKNGW